jgi:hypothetical protein
MMLEVLRNGESDEPPRWSKLEELFVSRSPQSKDKDSPLSAVITTAFRRSCFPSRAFFRTARSAIRFQGRSAGTACEPRFARLFRDSLDHRRVLPVSKLKSQEAVSCELRTQSDARAGRIAEEGFIFVAHGPGPRALAQHPKS